MMKILLLTHSLPHSKRTSNQARAFNWLKYLGRRHKITLVSFIDSSQEKESIEEIRPYCDQIITVLRKPKNRLFYRIINLFQNKPYFITKEYGSSKMREQLRSIIKNNNFDLVHVYSLLMAGYLTDIQGIHKILDPGDAITRNYFQQWRSSVALGRRFLSLIDWLKLKRYEPYIFSKYDKCILVSPKDKEFMQRHYSSWNIEVITCGIDLEYFRPRPQKEEFPSLIFTGTMSYLPNADAMEYFCLEILPLIEKKYPGIRLYITGGGVSDRLKRLANKKSNIILTGFVKDIHEFIAKASVFICPLRLGTGVKTKVIEAMALEKSIVSSSIGTEGINIVAGRDVFVADNAKDFADAVISLLDNKELRLSVGKNAREVAERDHDYQLLSSKLEKIYRGVTQKV